MWYAFETKKLNIIIRYLVLLLGLEGRMLLAATWGPRSKIYETSIAPGAGAALDVIFPEEGTYFGNDHDIGHLLIGGGFVVIASSKSMVEG